MANWLLELLGVDVALAGDIREELRRSHGSGLRNRAMVAVCSGVWNPVRDDKLTALRAVSVWSLLIG